MKTVFLPPGIQARLADRCVKIPRQLTSAAVAKIDALWTRRNNAPENELDAIDAAMEAIVVFAVDRARARQPRTIVESHNLHGTGYRRHKVIVMRSKSLRDFWRSVTDVKCPCCDGGVIRWHEAGYVPGWRICDGCGRQFMASGNAALPRLILDT